MNHTEIQSHGKQRTYGPHVQAESSSQGGPDDSSMVALHPLEDIAPGHLSKRHDDRNPSEDVSGNVTGIGTNSAMQKIGKWTIVILSVSLLLTLAIFGFLAFLWEAPHDNGFWHTIIAKGWANRAVTVSALLLRTAVDLQAGTAAAMLAAIFLET